MLRKAALSLLLAASFAVPVASQMTAPADPLPPSDPKFFDAAAPTADTVNAFLKQLWGYDSTRLYRVMAIQKTSAPGVAKVTVFVTQPGANAQIQTVTFFTTPDGNFAISDTIFPFGARPFEPVRQQLIAGVDGPARGAQSNDLLLVEFADLQCPHCRVAQQTIANILRDFPNARVVFQNFPLVSIHAFAFKAAAYGNCIAAKKHDAFFTYMDYVFAHQEALNAEAGDKTLADAVTAAGLAPAAIATCADSPAEKAHVQHQIDFADKLGITETPMLAVNGQLLPVGSIPYEQLKLIIAWRAQPPAGK